jgi:lysosomal acid lipase/cholesteryl ester hydrolase
VAGTEQSRPVTPKTPTYNNRSPSRASFDSQRSTGSKIGTGRFGDKGISLGVAKAISGLVDGEGHGEASGIRSDGERSLEASTEEKKRKRKLPKKKASALPVVS